MSRTATGTSRSATIPLLALAATIAVVYFTYSYGVLPQIDQLQEQLALHHSDQVQTHLTMELDTLEALVMDYTELMENDDQNKTATIPWPQRLTDEMLRHHGLDEAAVYRNDGTVLFHQSDHQTEPDNTLCRKAFNLTRLSPRLAISGLLRDDPGICLVAARSVGDHVVILCRHLTNSALADWSRRLHLTISLTATDLSDRTDDFTLSSNTQLQQPVLRTANHAIEIQTILVDISKQPIAIMHLTLPRQAFLSAAHASMSFFLIAAIALCLIVLLSIRFSRHLTQIPVIALIEQLRCCRQQKQATLNEEICQGTTPAAELAQEVDGLLQDLSECRLNQTLSEVRTDLIKKVVPCAIFTVDQRRIITSWNDRAEQLTGYRAKEMIGSSCYRFALTPCHTECGLFNSQVAKPVMGRECTIRHKNGSLLTISKNAELLRDSQGSVIGGIECFVDITHHKRDEQALQWEVSLNSRLASLSHAIVQQHADQHEVARQLLSHARNLTNSEHGFIAALDQSGSQSLWDFTSLFDDFSIRNGVATIAAPTSGRGSLLYAVYNRRTGVYFNDLERLNVAHLAGGIDKPIRHFMAVPVDDGEQIVGQVALANNEEGYSVRDLQAIEQLAELFAVFLAQKNPA